MRFVAIILITLVGLSACTKKTTVSRDGASTRLTDVQWKVSKLFEGTWKVGRTMRDLVSRNLTVILDTPVIDDEDEEYLMKTYGIDSWLIRVTQIGPTSSRMELGTLHIPFRGSTRGRTGGLAVKSISFSLTYAASAMSERFRRFNCPAFSHDRRLDDYEIEGEQKPMEVVVMAGPNYEEKLQKNELVPTTYNIGHTMVGQYTMEVALLNSSKKQIYSSFQFLPFKVRVESEDTVKIDGCAGVHQEYDAPKSETTTKQFIPRR